MDSEGGGKGGAGDGSGGSGGCHGQQHQPEQFQFASSAEAAHRPAAGWGSGGEGSSAVCTAAGGAAPPVHCGGGGVVPNSLPPTLPARGLPNGLPRPASMQNRGNTLTNANSRDDSSGTRRLLDHYDFYRTPDNMKVRLGGGNYATVWKGVSRSTGEEVAFKIIVKNDVTVAEANPMHAELLKMVDHKNIIQLKDYFDEQKALCLVLELATGGDIVERVHSSGVFTEAAAVRYSRQILSALAHCHKRGLVHCDIKCENILFASRAADSELKIADFGLAQLLQRGDKLMAGRGTPEYVAPEVIESTGYDTSADMWSVGVLIYTWMSGVFPFTVSEKEKIAKTQNSKDTENLTTEHLTRARDAHRDLLYTKISECTYSEANLDKVSGAAKDFIRRLLVRNPKERMTAEEALQHPWIANASPPSDPLTHNFRSLRHVREQEGVSHAFYSVLFNSSFQPGTDSVLLVAATSSCDSEDLEIMGRGVAPLVTMAFSLKSQDQEQAAELIANYLLKRGFRERLVEGGVFRALCHLAESSNIKVLNFVGLAMYRIAGGKVQRTQLAKNIPIMQKILLLGQHRSNTVARQAGRALCEMLKEDSIRQNLLDMGALAITCRLLQSDMIAHQAEALASWGYLSESFELQPYLFASRVEAIKQIHKLITRENTSHSTLGVFFQAAFILQTLTKDRLLEVGPQIVAHALPTLETLAKHAMELIKSPAMRTLRRLMTVFHDSIQQRASDCLKLLVSQIITTQAYADELKAVQEDQRFLAYDAEAAVSACEAGKSGDRNINSSFGSSSSSSSSAAVAAAGMQAVPAQAQATQPLSGPSSADTVAAARTALAVVGQDMKQVGAAEAAAAAASADSLRQIRKRQRESSTGAE